MRRCLVVAVAVFGIALVGCTVGRRDVSPPAERLLFSFEKSLPLYAGTANPRVVAKHATEGKHSLHAQLRPGKEAIIISSGGFPMDWRDYQRLCIDVFREGAPLTVHLRVTDLHSNRLWVWSAKVPSGSGMLQYDLEPMAQKIDLSVVCELLLVAEQPTGALYLDNVRVCRDNHAPR